MTEKITSYDEKRLLNGLSEVIAERLRGEHVWDFADEVVGVIAAYLEPGQVFEDRVLLEWAQGYVSEHGIDALGLEVQE